MVGPQKAKYLRKSNSPLNVNTALGPTVIVDEADIAFSALDDGYISAYVSSDERTTTRLLSMGLLCQRDGYEFRWPPFTDTPWLVSPTGRIIACRTSAYTPKINPKRTDAEYQKQAQMIQSKQPKDRYLRMRHFAKGCTPDSLTALMRGWRAAGVTRVVVHDADPRHEGRCLFTSDPPNDTSIASALKGQQDVVIHAWRGHPSDPTNAYAGMVSDDGEVSDNAGKVVEDVVADDARAPSKGSAEPPEMASGNTGVSPTQSRKVNVPERTKPETLERRKLTPETPKAPRSS